MQIWEKHSKAEILSSITAEIAKAQNELRCARGDVEKAQGRIQFALSAVKHLTDIQDRRHEEIK